MNRIILSLLILISIPTLKAQNSIKMSVTYGVENQNLQTILQFQDIKMESFTFNGDLTDKDYLINIQEFKNGELINEDVLFDSSESDYFKIKSDTVKLTFLSQNQNNNLAIQFRGNRFFSQKVNYETFSDHGKYTLKDFLGQSKFIEVPLNEEFPIFAIITPKIYEDGRASYCDVANSGIDPQNLGKEFDIPHYFLIQMQFK